MKERLHLTIKGRVQGVFFRQFVLNEAKALSITGWVRNLENGDVEVMAEGEKEELKMLMHKCHEGPSGARVEEVRPAWLSAQGDLADFRVVHT